MVMVPEPCGRARIRAHSMLGAIKGTGEDEVVGYLSAPIDHIKEPTNYDTNHGGSSADASRLSELKVALQMAGIGEGSTSKPITIKPSAPIPSTIFTPEMSFTGESDKDVPDYIKAGEQKLRKWCTGTSPKKSFLGNDGRLPFTRRSTLADKPELDILLAATKIKYKGHLYLPLTAQTIHRLSPYWKGEKPIADTKLFECILINGEINGVHADHVVAALERIGNHCKHLVVVSPIQTSELGNVFNREAGNINPGSDWACILKCFPNLEYMAFVHNVDEPVELSRNTFFALHKAVATRQVAQQVKSFEYHGSPQLLTNLHYDINLSLADN